MYVTFKFFFYVHLYANNLFQDKKNIKKEQNYCLCERNLCVCVFLEGSFGNLKNKMQALLTRLAGLEVERSNIQNTGGFVVQYTQPGEPRSWLDTSSKQSTLLPP